jgi:hypothetical protein
MGQRGYHIGLSSPKLSLKIFRFLVYTLFMDLQQLISFGFRQLEYDQKTRHFEWHHVKGPIQEFLLNPIIAELERAKAENDVLRAKVNQLTFKSDLGRDKKITELYQQGLSRAEISRRVGLSKWGVSLALRRLRQVA